MTLPAKRFTNDRFVDRLTANHGFQRLTDYLARQLKELRAYGWGEPNFDVRRC